MSVTKESAADFIRSASKQPEKPTAELTAGEAVFQGEGRNKPDPTLGQKTFELGSGATDYLLDLLNLPNDVFNYAAEKLGSNTRVASLRDLGADWGMANREGEEPDTGTYRAGKFTGMGLSFLAPFLGITKASKGTVELPKAATKIKENYFVGHGKNITETFTKPFIANPKTAYTGEIASSIAAGYGSKLGEDEYGVIGEQVGGLIGGMAPAYAVRNVDKLYRYAVDSAFPFTELGGRQRAGNILREIIERPKEEILAEVQKSKDHLLPGMKMTFGRLAKDDHLLALEKTLAEQDPQLLRKLKNQDKYNNFVSKKWMQSMTGDEAVEEAKRFLGSKYLQLSARLQGRVDLAINKARDAIADLAPTERRNAVNKAARGQLDAALKEARDGETRLWNKVDPVTQADNTHTVERYIELLGDMDRAADKDDIPAFVYKMLGRQNKKGELKGGTLKGDINVGEMQTFRKRLLNRMRELKAAEAPNWNRVRIVDDLQEAVLKDLSESPMSNELRDALDWSRELNMKFRGDIMDVIMGHQKTGGSLAPELTLDNLGAGRKGYWHISRLLAAQPEMKPNIEEILKMNIANSSVIKDGRINLTSAKNYMKNNKDTMDIFPELKSQMDHAIGMEEKVSWFKDAAVNRLKKAKKSSAYMISISKPGRVLKNIMTADYPEKTMAHTYQIMNEKGRLGIKNDIFDSVMDAAETQKTGFLDRNIVSGEKAQSYWNNHKPVFRHAFKDDPVALKRLEQIIDNMRMTDKVADLPVDAVSEVLNRPPKGLLTTGLNYAVGVAAARFGAQMGQGTHGASLKTASMASNLAHKFLGELNTKTANQLLKDALTDNELYEALLTDVTEIPTSPHVRKVLHTWMLSTAIESMEPVNPYAPPQ